MPEALECWPLPLFARLLPRHLEIIYQINERFLDKVRIACLGDSEQLARMSIIGEDGERSMRIAHLACVGSHAINGVAELHTELQEVIHLIRSGLFSRGDTGLFQPLLDMLVYNDPFFVFADAASYTTCQQQVGKAFLDEEKWARMAILNTARMGWFSSDRSIREYCKDIWALAPVDVQLEGSDGAGFLQSLQ